MPTTLLILITTLCTIGSQLILKRAVGGIAQSLQQHGVMSFLLSAATNPYIILALSIQGFGYVVWLFVLTRSKLAIAFAISGSFFYLAMALASWCLYSERINGYQWAGLCCITVGVLLINFFGNK